MPRSASSKPTVRRNRTAKRAGSGSERRFTVGLEAQLATKVRTFADTAETSMSKAIASLVRLGLERQEIRKQEFLRKLRTNLADGDPARQDELVDEFRDLILGR